MTFAFIAVGIMVSPVLVAPFVVIFGRRFKESRLLRRLEAGGAKAFRGGEIEFRTQFDFLDPCDRKVTACCSESVCGGQLIDVEESYRAPFKESGRAEREITALIRIGILCLRCGHLEKTADSHLIGSRYDHVHSAEQLAFHLNDRAELVSMGVPI